MRSSSEQTLLRLSQFDGFKSIEEESWGKKLERRRSVSPVCLRSDSSKTNSSPKTSSSRKTSSSPKTSRPKTKKHSAKKIKKKVISSSIPKNQKKNTDRAIRRIQYFSLPRDLSKDTTKACYPLRVPNALCTNQSKTIERMLVPESVREREISHSRSLINIYHAKYLQDDQSLRAQSRRRISEAARKSRQRYLLDHDDSSRGGKGSLLLERSNRPSSVHRFRPQGFDWTTRH